MAAVRYNVAMWNQVAAEIDGSRSIEELAADLLATEVGELPAPLPRSTGASLLDSRDFARLLEILSSVRVSGTPGEVQLAMRSGARFRLRVSLFREARTAHFLVRLQDLAERAADAVADGRARFFRVVEQLPDGFAVTDSARTIVAANSAFVELVQLPSLAQAIGRPITRKATM